MCTERPEGLHVRGLRGSIAMMGGRRPTSCGIQPLAASVAFEVLRFLMGDEKLEILRNRAHLQTDRLAGTISREHGFLDDGQ